MNFIGCESVPTIVNDAPVCSSGWVSFTAEQLNSELMSSVLIDSILTSEQIFTAISFGFGAVVFFWFLGAKIGVGKTLIKKM